MALSLLIITGAWYWLLRGEITSVRATLFTIILIIPVCIHLRMQVTGTQVHDQADLMLLLSRSKLPILIVLYSNYSAACMFSKPLVDRLDTELGEGQVDVVRIDVQSKKGRMLAEDLDFEMVPTYIILDKLGKETWRRVGLASHRELFSQIEPLL